jgi:hypothetical protein
MLWGKAARFRLVFGWAERRNTLTKLSNTVGALRIPTTPAAEPDHENYPERVRLFCTAVRRKISKRYRKVSGPTSLPESETGPGLRPNS